MIANHYGITVNSDIPTTGVFTCNKISYLMDDMFGIDGVNAFDVTCHLCEEERKEKAAQSRGCTIDEMCEQQEDFDYDENGRYCCDGCMIDYHEVIIGFKDCKKEDSIFTNINKNIDEEAEYSAIIGEITLQVLRSKWVIKGSLCSPCYPGQVDAESKGDFWGWSLPPDLYDVTLCKENKEIVNRIQKWEDVKKKIERRRKDDIQKLGARVSWIL